MRGSAATPARCLAPGGGRGPRERTHASLARAGPVIPVRHAVLNEPLCMGRVYVGVLASRGRPGKDRTWLE